MNLKEIHHIYFIGIGGIGMSALAKYFHKNGKKVGGYDKTTTKITATLQASGIHVHFDDSIENIPFKFQQKETTLVVYSLQLFQRKIENSTSSSATDLK